MIVLIIFLVSLIFLFLRNACKNVHSRRLLITLAALATPAGMIICILLLIFFHPEERRMRAFDFIFQKAAIDRHGN